MQMFYIFLVVFLAKNVWTWNLSRYDEGYHKGFLTDCPSSLKPASISKESLKKLGLIVVGSNTKRLLNGRRYNYYETKQMVKDPNWDFTKKTVFFVGGYLDEPNLLGYSHMLGNIYKNRNYNALLLFAAHFVIRPFPVTARILRPVGFHIAEMLTNLTSIGLDPKDLHLVGVSLGGQTVSFIAKNFYKLTGKKIGRITALDPAGPCFRNLGPDQRLDKSDADFVDVLVANIGGMGMGTPVGHATFYMNGGEYQPQDFYTVPCNMLCSHLKATLVAYSSLLHPYSFIGVKCDSVQQARRHECFDRIPMETNTFSMYIDKNKTGIFYVATTSDWPYYLGKEGLKKENVVWSNIFKKYDSDVLILR